MSASQADFAHTSRARADREVKAAALAAAAAAQGLGPSDLSAGGEHRRDLLRAAGYKRASEESWHAAAVILADMVDRTPPGAPRGQHRCSCGAPASAGLYLSGYKCPSCTPAALAGHPEPPRPPVGTTAAELRARRAGPAPPVVPASPREPRTTSTDALYMAQESARRHRDKNHRRPR